MADVVQTNPRDHGSSPGGHYSHAVTANGFVFVSGELPIAPDGTNVERRAVRAAGAAGARQRGGWR